MRFEKMIYKKKAYLLSSSECIKKDESLYY